MNLDKKRYLVLAFSLLVNLCIGSGYAWSVFASPLIKMFGWAAVATALTFTIANLISPFAMMLGGTLQDRFGPRWIVFAGAFLFGGGQFLCGFVNSIGLLYLCYGVLGGIGMSICYNAVVVNSVKFFPDKRGLISGASAAGYGLGSVVCAPVAQAVISAHGVMFAFRVMGIAYFVIILACSFFIRTAPMGYHPGRGGAPSMMAGADDVVVDGGAASEAGTRSFAAEYGGAGQPGASRFEIGSAVVCDTVGGEAGTLACGGDDEDDEAEVVAAVRGGAVDGLHIRCGHTTDKNWAEMLRTPRFYLLFAMLVFGAISGLMIISQASMIVQDIARFTPAIAAIVVSVVAVCNTTGRLAWGALSDRIGRYNVFPFMYTILAVMMLLLAVFGTKSGALVVICVACIGFAYGGFMGVFPALTTDCFGPKNSGLNFAIMFVGFGLAAYVGPVLAAGVKTVTGGNYAPAFLSAAALAIVGIVLTFVVKRKR